MYFYFYKQSGDGGRRERGEVTLVSHGGKSGDWGGEVEGGGMGGGWGGVTPEFFRGVYWSTINNGINVVERFLSFHSFGFEGSKNTTAE